MSEVRKASLLCTHRLRENVPVVTDEVPEQGHTGSAVEGLQSFKAIAHDSGFVGLEESENGTVLWLRRQSPDAATNTHQRICTDSVTNSVTVYWTTSLGKVESKTFRTATDLREWLASQAVR